MNLSQDLFICVQKSDRSVIYTVEVGSLHTFRLESLKLIFLPLHKFLVNRLTGYFVHDASNCSNNCLQTDYFIYHNFSESEVYIHKLTVPLNSLENDRK